MFLIVGDWQVRSWCMETTRELTHWLVSRHTGSSGGAQPITIAQCFLDGAYWSVSFRFAVRAQSALNAPSLSCSGTGGIEPTTSQMIFSLLLSQTRQTPGPMLDATQSICPRNINNMGPFRCVPCRGRGFPNSHPRLYSS